ncbi:hypothetical protein L798_02060 [Zootermopsis nevadensis]|uniref:Uncharacterized protein n=1 Tax=Zootermopsis nevadensis TaxID=136037 RepID=A0A067REB0_ZOONE|nr:hypothetical protein L798_02060 [Zootermopsis nevadensis]
MQGLRLLLLLACASGVLTSLPLPSYVKPCAKSDAKFSECAKKHAQDVLSHPALVRGDAKYKVPPLNPLKITKLVAEENGMTITLTDLNIYGLLGATVNNIR